MITTPETLQNSKIIDYMGASLYHVQDGKMMAGVWQTVDGFPKIYEGRGEV
jgi:hypothetical protein